MSSRIDILNRMVNSLTLSDNEWDISPGTPEFKILEAVANEISTVYNNKVLQDYHFDIDTKLGQELEEFVEMFGLQRKAARRAVGTVTFKRGTPADQDYFIPANTQVARPRGEENNEIIYQTVASVVLSQGETQVEVPVEAVVGGQSGNAPTGTVTAIANQLNGISLVVNETPMTGGRNRESDQKLRRRWRETAFRGVTGTNDAFLSASLEHDDVARAIVVGPVHRGVEQLQVVDTVVESRIEDSKFTYPAGSEFFGYDINTPEQELGTRDTDYTFSDVVPARVDILNSNKFPHNAIVDLEYDYIPTASRNRPADDIFNKVDVFVSGQVARKVFEEVLMRQEPAVQFDATDSTSDMYVENWIHDDGTHPAEGNWFLQLTQVPLISLPETITVNSVIYEKDVDYWLIRDDTVIRSSPLAKDGIEWLYSNAPADGEIVVVEHFFNELIRNVDAFVKEQKSVTQDVLAHRAQEVRLRVNLAVVFEWNTSVEQESEQINTVLSAYMEGKDFRSSVRVADIIEATMQLDGVRNIRLMRETEDATNYGMQIIARDGDTILQSTESDIFLESDQVPVLEGVRITVRGANTI